jgi:hypothetical protein
MYKKYEAGRRPALAATRRKKATKAYNRKVDPIALVFEILLRV